MATSTAAHGEWLAARARLKSALEAAGIAAALAEMNERSSYSGTTQANTDRERELVFAILDIDLRKAVIQANRDCMETMAAYDKTTISELHDAVRDGGERLHRKALWSAVAFVAVGVVAGSQLFGTTGAIAGAAVSLLIGLDQMRRAGRDGARAVASAQADLAERQTSDSDFPRDEIFSREEAATGLPDSRPG